MTELKIKLENCYGIGKFEKTFNFSNNKNSYLIYAPNGTMKSSFAKTFNDISKNDKKTIPSDRLYKNRKSIFEVLVDNSPINPDIILVVDAEDNSFDASSKISNFIASKELKKAYDNIYTELDLKKTDFIKKLKNISQSSDCESEFINTFSNNPISFFVSLDSIILKLEEKFPKYNFRYNDIFDKKGNVSKFLEKNKSLLGDYLNNYQNLLLKSTFFKNSDNSFGTLQANEILKSTEDNSFFDAGHKFVLDGNLYIDSAEKLRDLVQDEITNIINDIKLKEIFDKVDKSIGVNIELRSFKKVVEKDNLLLLELEDYDKFKQKVWLSYLSNLKVEAIELSKFYNSKKKDLEKILFESKKEFKIWSDIVTKFNSRFYVPFKVIISNQEDIILKQETANFEFIYDDKKDTPILQTKENLLKILSKGEQRAYFILQFLFEIESRKTNNNNLLIFDDIADSFDYKNKYAIIEYIKDLHNSSNFKSIILTHNFDFYRTISSRLSLGNSVFMATKNENREINIYPGQYRKDVFKHFLKNLIDPKVFISLITFVRNLVEYSNDDKCEEYLKLTNCLHLKKESISTTANDILTIYKSKILRCSEVVIDFGEQNIIDLISKTAESIIMEANIDEILLENKIVLSIEIRLKAEKYMIKCLPNFNVDTIEFNQTRILFEEFRNNYNGKDVEILDKVNLMTPENIHMNAFMYEPLIDMSFNHLKTLYDDVNALFDA